MKRRLLFATVFVLAGAVANVAVAWGIAAASTTYDEGEFRIIQRPDNQSLAKVLTCFGCEQVVQGPSSGRLSDIEDQGWSWQRSASDPEVLSEEACGWPRLSMRWCLFRPVSDPALQGALELGGVRQYSLRDGTGILVPWVGDRTMPLIPIWSGFAVNTLLFTALLVTPFVPRRLVRSIRLNRGLCPGCGYPMGESAVCTECGNAVPSRKVRVT